MYRITTNNDVVTYVCEAHYTGMDESTIKEFEIIDNIPGMCNKCEEQLNDMYDDIELDTNFYPDQFE